MEPPTLKPERATITKPNSKFATEVDSICDETTDPHICFVTYSEEAKVLANEIKEQRPIEIAQHEEKHAVSYSETKVLGFIFSHLETYFENQKWEPWKSLPWRIRMSESKYADGLAENKLHREYIEAIKPLKNRMENKLTFVEEIIKKKVTLTSLEVESTIKDNKLLLLFLSTNTDAWDKLGIGSIMESLVQKNLSLEFLPKTPMIKSPAKKHRDNTKQTGNRVREKPQNNWKTQSNEKLKKALTNLSGSKPNITSGKAPSVEKPGISKQKQKQKTPKKPLTRDERLAKLRKDSADSKTNSQEIKDEWDSKN